MLDFGIIQTKPEFELEERLVTIHDDLSYLIAQTKPDLIGIEKLFFYKMASVILVAQARGVILLTIKQHGIPFKEFTPAQIKQSLTGHGNADKIMVQEAVMRELSLAKLPKPDDAADALAIGLTTAMHV